MALGGEAGASLARHFGWTISPDTLIRIIKNVRVPTISSPRYLGVDDFAFRKGQTYGTVIVDLERHKVIDLLPDRKSETLAEWLKKYPDIQIISRDRAGAYAEGSRAGAPQAVQVADRWHLLKNLGDAIERILTLSQASIKKATELTQGNHPVLVRPVNPVSDTGRLPQAESLRQERLRVKRGHYNQARALSGKGMSVENVAKMMGKNQKTIRKYLNTPVPETNRRGPRRKAIDRYSHDIEKGLRTGLNTGEILENLKARGYSGSLRTLQRWIKSSRPRKKRNAHTRIPFEMPSPRKLKLWMVKEPEDLEEIQKTFLENLYHVDPKLKTTATLSQSFSSVLLNEKKESAWHHWRQCVEKSGHPIFKSFIKGLLRDEKAVLAAIVTNWSNGQTEGQVNKIKTIKRQMYGRGSFELLRKKVLLF